MKFTGLALSRIAGVRHTGILAVASSLLMLAFVSMPLTARAATAQALSAPTPLPSGSTVQMYPYYSSHSQLAQASVGQAARATIQVPLDYQGFAPSGDIDVYIVSFSNEQSTCAGSAPHLLINSEPNGGSTTLFVDASFTWPSSATTSAFGSPYYAICLHVEDQSQHTFPDYFSWTSQDGPASAAPDRLFQVVSNFAPTANLSATTIAQGRTLTVTGQNWIPVYSDVSNTQVGANIYQYPSTDMRLDYASQHVNVSASGNFSVSFFIPTSYPVGVYYMCVGSVQVNAFCDGFGTGITFHVVSPQAAPPATPTRVAATLTATPVSGSATPVTPAVSSTLTAGGPGAVGLTSNSADSGGIPWPLIALMLVVLGCAVVLGATLVLVRKRDSRYHS